MSTPPLDESTEFALFDSFVKKVVRNTAIKTINKAKKEKLIYAIKHKYKTIKL